MIRVKSVQVLEEFKVQLFLTDGSARPVDLSRHLPGPVFEPLREDPAMFRQVKVDPKLCAIVWPNGADVCPDVPYPDRVPGSTENAVH